MSKIKKRVYNSYYALFYQFVCVPLLSLFSFFCYKLLVLNIDYDNLFLNVAVISILIILNITAVYFIAKVLIKKFKCPLIYNLVVGAFTMVGVLWLNVYYGTLENVTCTDFSALKCVDSIVNGKSALLALVACIYFYFIYIFIYKIVESRMKVRANK